MTVNFYFKNISQLEEIGLKNYFISKKMVRLKRLLQYGNDQLAKLRVRAERFEKHNAFVVDMELKIGSNRLVGSETSHDLQKSLDFALDRLIAQLRKFENKKHK